MKPISIHKCTFPIDKSLRVPHNGMWRNYSSVVGRQSLGERETPHISLPSCIIRYTYP